MLSQIKLQLVQSLKSHNKDATRSTKKMGCFSSSCDFDQMRGYDAFDSTGELEAFEEGVFGFENQPISRQDAFIDTLFDFNLWDEHNGTKNNVGHETINENGDDSEWDPSQVFSKHKEVQ
ncbi:hypothetical protein O181_021708 [Austropuccinia psidii MF-1]|uniref:Uncharacterized protein n=1 Tax=Austropuccinia psidii MF-1 TaxID=1389203 RepID=A0A9Q3CFE8_9BASI|nr:hypothetical protein [Austropuccinia psidii MF-1]